MEIEYRQVMEQARKIAARHRSFTVRVAGADTFGHRGQDRVLFLGIAFSDELARLKKDCPWPRHPPEEGNAPNDSFHPHLTLARIKHPERFQVHKKRIMKLLSEAAFDIPIDRLRLYAEVDGRKQTPLQDFLLHS